MDDIEFQTKYPNVHFSVAKNLHADDETLKRARHNIQFMFDVLPEDHKTVLNQLGLEIEIGQGRNGVKRHSRNPAQLASFAAWGIAPHRMKLDAELFSKFECTPDFTQDDWQRKAQYTLNEETTHAATMRLCGKRQWQQAVQEELRSSNKLQDLLLECHRTYNGIPQEDGTVMSKASMEDYKNRILNDPRAAVGALDEISYEWPTEIMHSRNLLNAVRQHAGQDKYERKDIQTILRVLGRYYDGATEEVKDAITETLLLNAFPHTYPLFQEYERRLSIEAGDIKKSPNSYPVLLDMGLKDQMQIFRHKRENKWNEAFRDFLSGPESQKR